MQNWVKIQYIFVPCRIRKLCMYAIDPIVYFRCGCAVVRARQGDCSGVDTLFRLQCRMIFWRSLVWMGMIGRVEARRLVSQDGVRSGLSWNWNHCCLLCRIVCSPLLQKAISPRLVLDSARGLRHEDGNLLCNSTSLVTGIEHAKLEQEGDAE